MFLFYMWSPLRNLEEFLRIIMLQLLRQRSQSNDYDDNGRHRDRLLSGSLGPPMSPIPSYWEIPWENMILENIIIAEGNFGQVMKAVVKKDGVAYEAAVKVLKGTHFCQISHDNI